MSMHAEPENVFPEYLVYNDLNIFVIIEPILHMTHVILRREENSSKLSAWISPFLE
jgi:hypothetical protein